MYLASMVVVTLVWNAGFWKLILLTQEVEKCQALFLIPFCRLDNNGMGDISMGPPSTFPFQRVSGYRSRVHRTVIVVGADARSDVAFFFRSLDRLPSFRHLSPLTHSSIVLNLGPSSRLAHGLERKL